MVYSADVIPGAEALAAQKRLAALLSYKLKREYSEMYGFVRARISLAIVRPNSLILCGPRDKGARIRQRLELTDGAVMPLLAPWRGYILGGRTGRTGRVDGRKEEEVRRGHRRIAREILESAYSLEDRRERDRGRRRKLGAE